MKGDWESLEKGEQCTFEENAEGCPEKVRNSESQAGQKKKGGKFILA